MSLAPGPPPWVGKLFGEMIGAVVGSLSTQEAEASQNKLVQLGPVVLPLRHETVQMVQKGVVVLAFK